LKAPGFKVCFAFKFNLHRYNLDLSSHATFLTDRLMLKMVRNDGAFSLLRSVCLSGGGLCTT
jgi:hypothetical protein